MGGRYLYWCPRGHPGESKKVFYSSHPKLLEKKPYFCPVCRERFSAREMEGLNPLVVKRAGWSAAKRVVKRKSINEILEG